MRTRWFKGLAHPGRKGHYEWLCTASHPSTLRWDGRKWMDGQREWGPCDACKWRGLTERAK